MAEPIQCDNCGAVLLAKDDFCGECGAPRPSPPPAAVASEAAAVAAAAPTSRPIPPSDRTATGWRAAVIGLAIVGAVLCVLGLAAFLLFGLTDSEFASPAENWLYATLCCLLPIAGSGVILAFAAGGIWLTRLRKR
jgi:hypothetical protein